MPNKDTILKELFYDPSLPSGFGGINSLYAAAKKYGISKRYVTDYLSKQKAYTLHKPVIRKFKRNKTWVPHQFFQLQADLADMRSLASSNYGHKYILTIIDVLSRYAWAISIKNKKPHSIIAAFKIVFAQQKPLYLQTDRGKEFVNSQFKSFLEKENVKFFTTRNQTVKCALVERFNRTLKNKIYKFMTANNTKRWYPHLQDFAKSYNNSIHRSIGVTPESAKEMRSDILFASSYGNRFPNTQQKHRKLLLGDQVRIAKHLSAFNKGYLPNWSTELFNVTNYLKKDDKFQYTVSEQSGKESLQRYYTEEIQKVNKAAKRTYVIEKVLEKKTVNGVEYVKVKWRNYPPTFNKWIPARSISKYQ